LRTWDPQDLDLLYPWSVEGRYPARTGDVTTRIAASVVDAAERVVSAIEAALGTR
jgi:hypothetical protein